MKDYGQFTVEQKTWIADNIQGKYYKDILDEFNQQFNMSLKLPTFRYRCIRDGLRARGKIGGLNDFTDAMDSWLVDNTHRGWKIVVTEFNQLFNTNYDREKIRRHCERFLKHKSGIVRQTYQTQQPLFSKRYNAKDDCIEIKVCDEIGKCKWVSEHIYICEQLYGKLPQGTKIIHLNGNRCDNRVENLYITTNSIMIAAQHSYDWDIKVPAYRLCALKNSELSLLLRDKINSNE